jgi:hypothetical protein
MAKEATARISDRFSTRALYVSRRMGVAAASNFAELIDLRLLDDVNKAGRADTVFVSYRESEGLTIRFEANTKELLSKVYRHEEGLRITADGKIELPSSGGCGSGDGPGLGCLSRTVTLFINSDGDLAAVQSSRGGGLVTIIPFGVYSDLIAIFPRRQGELRSNPQFERDAINRAPQLER